MSYDLKVCVYLSEGYVSLVMTQSWGKTAVGEIPRMGEEKGKGIKN